MKKNEKEKQGFGTLAVEWVQITLNVEGFLNFTVTDSLINNSFGWRNI